MTSNDNSNNSNRIFNVSSFQHKHSQDLLWLNKICQHTNKKTSKASSLNSKQRFNFQNVINNIEREYSKYADHGIHQPQSQNIFQLAENINTNNPHETTNISSENIPSGKKPEEKTKINVAISFSSETDGSPISDIDTENKLSKESLKQIEEPKKSVKEESSPENRDKERNSKDCCKHRKKITTCPKVNYDTIIQLSPRNKERNLCGSTKVYHIGSSGVTMDVLNNDERFKKYFNYLDNDYGESYTEEQIPNICHSSRRDLNCRHKKERMIDNQLMKFNSICREDMKRNDLTYDDRYLYGSVKDEIPIKDSHSKLISKSENALNFKSTGEELKRTSQRATSPKTMIMNIENNITIPFDDCKESSESKCKRKQRRKKCVKICDSSSSYDSESSYTDYSSDIESCESQNRRRSRVPCERRKRRKCKRSSRRRSRCRSSSTSDDCESREINRRRSSTRKANKDYNVLELKIDIDENKHVLKDQGPSIPKPMSNEECKKNNRIKSLEDVPTANKTNTNIMIKSQGKKDELTNKNTTKLDVTINSVTSTIDDEDEDDTEFQEKKVSFTNDRRSEIKDKDTPKYDVNIRSIRSNEGEEIEREYHYQSAALRKESKNELINKNTQKHHVRSDEGDDNNKREHHHINKNKDTTKLDVNICTVRSDEDDEVERKHSRKSVPLHKERRNELTNKNTRKIDINIHSVMSDEDEEDERRHSRKSVTIPKESRNELTNKNTRKLDISIHSVTSEEDDEDERRHSRKSAPYPKERKNELPFKNTRKLDVNIYSEMSEEDDVVERKRSHKSVALPKEKKSELKNKNTTKLDVNIRSVSSTSDENNEMEKKHSKKSLPLQKESDLLMHSKRTKVVPLESYSDIIFEENSLMKSKNDTAHDKTKTISKNKVINTTLTEVVDLNSKEYIDDNLTLMIVPIGLERPKDDKINLSPEKTQAVSEHYVNKNDETLTTKTSYVNGKEIGIEKVKEIDQSDSSSYFKPTPPSLFPSRTNASDLSAKKKSINAEELVYNSIFGSYHTIKPTNKLLSAKDSLSHAMKNKSDIYRTNEMLLSKTMDNKKTHCRKASFWCLPYGSKSSIKKRRLIDGKPQSNVSKQCPSTRQNELKINEKDSGIFVEDTTKRISENPIFNENIQLLYNKGNDEFDGLQHRTLSTDTTITIVSDGFPNNFEADITVRHIATPSYVEPLITTPESHVQKHVQMRSPSVQTPSVHRLSVPSSPPEPESVPVALPFQTLNTNESPDTKKADDVFDKDNQNISRTPEAIFEKRFNDSIRYDHELSPREGRSMDPYRRNLEKATPKEPLDRYSIPAATGFVRPSVKEPAPTTMHRDKSDELRDKMQFIKPSHDLYPPKGETKRKSYEKRIVSPNSDYTDFYYQPRLDTTRYTKDIHDLDMYCVKPPITAKNKDDDFNSPLKLFPKAKPAEKKIYERRDDTAEQAAYNMYHLPKPVDKDQFEIRPGLAEFGYKDYYNQQRIEDPRFETNIPKHLPLDKEFKHLDKYSVPETTMRKQPYDTYDIYHQTKQDNKKIAEKNQNVELNDDYYKGQHHDPRLETRFVSNLEPHKICKDIDMYSLADRKMEKKVPKDPIDTYKLYHIPRPQDKHITERRQHYPDSGFTDYYHQAKSDDPRIVSRFRTNVKPDREAENVDMYSFADRREGSKTSHKSYTLYPPNQPRDINVYERRQHFDETETTDYYNKTRKHVPQYPDNFQPSVELQSFDRYSKAKHRNTFEKGELPKAHELYPRAVPEKGYVYEKRQADQESDFTDYYNRTKIDDNDLTYKVHDNVKSGLDLRNIDRYCLPQVIESKPNSTDFNLYPFKKVHDGHFYEGRREVIDSAYDYFHNPHLVNMEGASDIRNVDRYCMPTGRKESKVKTVQTNSREVTHPYNKDEQKVKSSQPQIAKESLVNKIEKNTPIKTTKDPKSVLVASPTDIIDSGIDDRKLYPPTKSGHGAVYEHRERVNDYVDLQLGEDLPNLDTLSLPHKKGKKRKPHVKKPSMPPIDIEEVEDTIRVSDVVEPILPTEVEEATQTLNPSKRIGTSERRSHRRSRESHRSPRHSTTKHSKHHSSHVSSHKPRHQPCYEPCYQPCHKPCCKPCYQPCSCRKQKKCKKQHKRSKSKRRIVCIPSSSESSLSEDECLSEKPTQTMNLRSQIQIEYDAPLSESSEECKCPEVVVVPTTDETSFDRVDNAVIDSLFIEFIDTLLSCYHVRWKPFIPKHLKNKTCHDDIPISDILKKLAKPAGDGYTNFCCNYCQRWIPQQKYDEHVVWCIETQKNAIIEMREQQEIDETKKENRRVASMPGTVCYICGRYYTNHTIKRHEVACIEKWNNWNEQLPESQRKSAPERSAGQGTFQKGQSGENKNFTANDAANMALIEASLKNQIDFDLF